MKLKVGDAVRTAFQLLGTCLASFGLSPFAVAEERCPNILVVLADDLGYGDLACYGGDDLRTPRIDSFAAKGMRLTDCYAASANCSPSRAGLMTGRTPFRVGVFDWIPAHSPMHVKRSEITDYWLDTKKRKRAK